MTKYGAYNMTPGATHHSDIDTLIKTFGVYQLLDQLQILLT